MSHVSDRAYLLSEQYRNGSNLQARIQLHERFSTNPYGWQRWVFDQLDLPAGARVLELGCGPGNLWRENGERIPAGWKITLSDFSMGMLGEARRNLEDGGRPFAFLRIDAQAIPFPDASLDAVVANHMLYHVPDRGKALAEIRRVLRAGGRLYASTVGQNHMRELRELIRRLDPNAGRWTEAFNLENGEAELRQWFADVSLRRYEDALVVTELEPLVAYAVSGASKAALSGDGLAAFIRSVEQEMASRGAFRITKAAGLFVAREG